MPASILVDGAPQPILNAPLGVSLALTNAAGWADVAEVEWLLFAPSGSASVLTLVGPLLVPPFDNDFAPDLPGSYLVHLRVEMNDGSTARDRAVIQIPHPYAKDPRDSTDVVAPPAPHELGNDPDGGTSYPTRDATNGWAVAAERVMRLLLDARGQGGKWVAVYNGSGAPIAAGKVVRPATERDVITVYTGGPGGADPGVALHRDFIDIEPVDGTDVDDMAPGHDLFLLFDGLGIGEFGIAMLEGWIGEWSGILGAPLGPGMMPFGGPLWVDASGHLTCWWVPGNPPPDDHICRTVGALMRHEDLAGNSGVWFCGHAQRDQRGAAFACEGLWGYENGAGSAKPNEVLTAADRFAHFDITTGGGVTNALDVSIMYAALRWPSQWRCLSTAPILRVKVWAEAAGASGNLALYKEDGTLFALKNLSVSFPVAAWTEYTMDRTDLIAVGIGPEPLRPGERFVAVYSLVMPYAPDPWADGMHLKVTPLFEGPAAPMEW